MKKLVFATLGVLIAISGAAGAQYIGPAPSSAPNVSNSIGTLPVANGGTKATSLGPTTNNNNGVLNTNDTAAPAGNLYGGITPTYQTSFMSGVPYDWTFSRTGNAWYFNSSGLLLEAATGVARLDYDPIYRTENGLYDEAASTNNVLYSEDLTQTVWVKSNATVTLTATNIAGVANAASVVTATANAATVKQTITLASNLSSTSAFLKCIHCTGPVYLTQDGTNYTNGFYPATNQWGRYYTGFANITNPIVGIYIANSGDSVAVDVVQQETGATTSPIPTGATTVTRNAESLYLSNFSTLGFNPTGGSFVLEARTNPQVYGTLGLVDFTNSADSDVIQTFFNTDNNIHGQILNPSSYYGNGFGGPPSGIFRSGMTYGNGDNFVSYASGDSGTVANDATSSYTTATPPAAGNLTLLYLGGFRTNDQLSGYVRSFSYWNSPLPSYTQNQQTSLPSTASSCVQPMDWNVAAVNQCQKLQPGATDCQNALVNNVVPSDATGPVTISTGGTFSGHATSSSSVVSPVTITTSSAVTILNSNLSAPGGFLISYTGSGEPNITVINTTGFSTSKSSAPKVISLGSQANLTMLGNRFGNTGGIFVNGAGGSSSSVILDHNILYNINSTDTEPHAIQLGNSANSSNLFTGGITNNDVINAPYESNSNDAINVYNLSGTSTSLFPIHGNWIAGLFAANPPTGSNSGCGIIADNDTDYTSITYNTVLDTGNGGICIDTPATYNTVTNNTTISSGVINGTSPVAAQNVGIYVNGNTTNTVMNNFSYWMKATNTPITTASQNMNDYYFPNCLNCYNENLYGESTITNPNYLFSAIALEQKYAMPPSSCY
jgi:hypothetical protein